MTLKEKFKNILFIYEIATEEAKIDRCEQIADEFAIEFLNWYAMHGSWIEENLTSKELLEIYKKGL